MNDVCSQDKTVSVLTLFELYWVAGKSVNRIEEELDVYTKPNQCGIPLRSKEDADKIYRGDANVKDFWEKYLTKFQIQLAKELNTMRRIDQFKEIGVGLEDERPI
jgi:hypothetical protein